MARGSPEGRSCRRSDSIEAARDGRTGALAGRGHVNRTEGGRKAVTWRKRKLPDRHVDGYVRSTKPLFVSGAMVTGLTVRFERGQAVEIEADQGADTLRALARRDPAGFQKRRRLSGLARRGRRFTAPYQRRLPSFGQGPPDAALPSRPGADRRACGAPGHGGRQTRLAVRRVIDRKAGLLQAADDEVRDRLIVFDE